MILFAPAYDEPTRCTHLLALQFERDATEPLLGIAANRVNLLRALADSDDPVVAFAHGSEDHLRGHGGQRVLTIQDARSLSTKTVFAYACHTGTKLGGAMARTGNTWWGYSGAVAAPSVEATRTGFIAPVFRHLITSFLEFSDEVPPPAFFEWLKQLCEQAAHQFDELFASGVDVDTDTYLCLLHVWDRLRVWCPGSDGPAHHPRCQSEVALLG